MKPMSEAHFAILRRHMVEVIGIQVELASEELGKAALDERVLAAMRKVPRPPLGALLGGPLLEERLTRGAIRAQQSTAVAETRLATVVCWWFRK